jgi:hypothetical protein
MKAKKKKSKPRRTEGHEGENADEKSDLHVTDYRIKIMQIDIKE